MNKPYREQPMKFNPVEWAKIRKALADPGPIKREADSTDKNCLEKGKINNDLAIFKRPTTPPIPIIRIKPTPITVGTQTWATTRVKNVKPFPPKTYIAPKNIPTTKPKTVTVRPKPTPGKYAALHSKVKYVTLARPNPESKSVEFAPNGCFSVAPPTKPYYYQPKVLLSSNTIANNSVASAWKLNAGVKSMIVSTKPKITIKSVGTPQRPQIIFKSKAFSLNVYPNSKRSGTKPPPVLNIKKPLKGEIIGVSTEASKAGRYDHATIFRTESPTVDEKPHTENDDA